MAEYSKEIQALIDAKNAEIERVQQERTAERAQHQQTIRAQDSRIDQLNNLVMALKAELYDYITELGYSLEEADHGSVH